MIGLHTERNLMRDLLAGFAIVGVLIIVHAIAEFIAVTVPWLGVVLLAWVVSSIVLSMLQALGVVRIDLSKLRS